MNIKKLLAVLVLLLGFGTVANAQQFIQSQTLTNTAVATNYGLMQQNSNVVTHVLNWVAAAGTGAISSCTLQLQSAPDGVSWSSLGLAQTCTTTGSYATVGAFAYVRIITTAATLTGNATLTFNYFGYTTQQSFADGIYDVPFGNCGLSVPTTGVWAAGPASAGTYVGPLIVRAAAGELVLQGTTTAAASAAVLDCDITVPSRTSAGKAAIVTGYQLWYGVQTTTLTSITAPLVNTTTMPVTGGTAAGVVAAAGGTLTLNPVIGSWVLTTTASGACQSVNVSFGTPFIESTLNQKLDTTVVFNQTGAAADTYQICGLQVFYVTMTQ
jgi:hypothetical protein